MKLSNQKLGYLEGFASIAINTFLFGIKLWAGSRIGSVSMVADAWHTLSDTITSLVVLVGFWIMVRPADSEHPFGHARAENIAAIIIGVLLALVGIYFGWESIDRLLNRQAVTFSKVAIIVFSVSILFKEGLAQLAFWVGKKTNSKAVAADGWHHRSDAIASALIVVGAILGGKLWWIDGALGIAVALLIIWAAVGIIRETSSILLGEAVDEETYQSILSCIRAEYPVIADEVHHLHIHRYGSNIELTLHIRVPGNMSVLESHTISDCIENRLKQDLNLESTVHIEPKT